MDRGGVFDSIINQTSTPRAEDKVLMYLDNITPSDPPDNSVAWSDNEEPADPRFHMFAPEHRRKGNAAKLEQESEELLDELAQSEMSYPDDPKHKAGVRRSTEERNGSGQARQLENFGSRGWTPLVKALPLSPPTQPAGLAQSKQPSRPSSRIQRPPAGSPAKQKGPSRPNSTRPRHAQQQPTINELLRANDVEIEIQAPSSVGPGEDLRSLGSTDSDMRVQPHGRSTPRAMSPTEKVPRIYASPPAAKVMSPLRTPIDQVRSPPRHRSPEAAPNWWERTQYDAPGAGRKTGTATPKGRSRPASRTGDPKAPIIPDLTGEENQDEHVQSHVHEVTELERDVLHVKEQFDVGDNDEDRSTPKAVPQPITSEALAMVLQGEPVEEKQLVEMLKTPMTGYTNLILNDVALNNHHDEDLCILLQAADDELQHPVVRRAVKKAIASRLRKLGVAEDFDRDPALKATLQRHAYGGSPKATDVMLSRRLPADAPEWAVRLSEHMQELSDQVRASGMAGPSRRRIKGKGPETLTEEGRERGETEGTGYDGDSLHPGHAVDEGGLHYRPETEPDHDEDGNLRIRRPRGGEISPGERLYDEEVYKLRKTSAQSPRTHATWEIQEDVAPPGSALPADEMPEIPDSEYIHGTPKPGGSRNVASQDRHAPSQLDMALTASQHGGELVTAQTEEPDWFTRFGMDPNEPPSWLKVNQRLLNWAIVWPFTEFDNALKSCERGEQVDEIALSIWTTQVYKRYVRSLLTQYPPGKVDRMFVPPNIADAINNAAYNGRHDDAAIMLRDLWKPFGFKGHPRLIIVLARHRREENHWVVHRFSLPDASIITYDTYLEKALPDGRPLGWWFGIRIAFPNDAYPAPDQVIQRMIRLHRPLQLLIDNSVAAAGIWRNLIMGSKADRLVELDRLRDLIRQEVKSLRQRKEAGKLSLGLNKGAWDAATKD